MWRVYSGLFIQGSFEKFLDAATKYTPRQQKTRRKTVYSGINAERFILLKAKRATRIFQRIGTYR